MLEQQRDLIESLPALKPRDCNVALALLPKEFENRQEFKDFDDTVEGVKH